ncbi:outer membrane beta-barrel protein [Nonlabens ponticola]|uniref:PorT family protein n=1 Tax=Nonlabens ponticola TaxID=2496866 RepID=A0A3S9MZR2_9FLAO|nr:outer membrane beta-barrel protein [Nonlabens ponticola]AZQ44629.1 PorT family protein [Nonlabens ponticola]
MFKYLLLTTGLLMTFFTTAQVRNETAYGFRLGANYSDLDTDLLDDPDNRIGASVYFFAEIPLGKTFSLIPEIGFDALGVKEDRLILENGNPVDLKVNWASGGLLGQINITDFFYVNAGAKYALNVSENDDGDYYDSDIWATGGIGFRFLDGFSIDARYGYGLTNVFEGSLENQGFNAENRFYQIGISYRL